MCPQVLQQNALALRAEVVSLDYDAEVSCSICCEVIRSVSVAADNLAPSLLPSADKSIHHHPSSETFLANLERNDYRASPPPVDHEQKPVISRAMSAACRVSVLPTLQRAFPLPIVRPGMSYLVQVGEAVKLVGWDGPGSSTVLQYQCAQPVLPAKDETIPVALSGACSTSDEIDGWAQSALVVGYCRTPKSVFKNWEFCVHEVPHSPLLRCDNAHLSVVLVNVYWGETVEIETRQGIKQTIARRALGFRGVWRTMPEVLQHHFDDRLRMVSVGLQHLGMVLNQSLIAGVELYTLLEIEVNDDDFPTMEEVPFCGWVGLVVCQVHLFHLCFAWILPPHPGICKRLWISLYNFESWN